MDLAVLLPAGGSWLALVLLLSLRIGSCFAFSPLLSAAAIPGPARVLLVLGLAAAMSMLLSLPDTPPRLLDNPGELIAAAVSELTIGASMGLGIQLAFGAFSLAGRLLDLQVGFGLVQVFDPLSNVRGSILTTVFDQLAVVMFFVLNVHHVLLRGMAWSLERFPVGQPWPLEGALLPLLKQVSAMFTLGVALAGPVVFCLLLVELALGVVAHALPQMNMLMVGFPVKIIVGLVALALWVPEMGGVFSRIYESIYTTWSQMLAAGTLHAPAGGRTC